MSSTAAPSVDFSSTQLLFDVLRNHEDLAVRNASSDGKQALAEQNIDQVNYSVNDISDALQSWEQHPALAKQLKLSQQELLQHRQEREHAPSQAEMAPSAPPGSISSGPSM